MANNLDELYKEIKKAVNETLDDEVKTEARRIMRKNVEEHVYDAYGSSGIQGTEPKVYKRRYDEGGLSDIRNMPFNATGDLERTLTNATRSKDGSYRIAWKVEFGEGYKYTAPRYNQWDDDGRTYNRPRRFTERTREELRDGDYLEKSMKKGLEKRGMNVN